MRAIVTPGRNFPARGDVAVPPPFAGVLHRGKNLVFEDVDPQTVANARSLQLCVNKGIVSIELVTDDAFPHDYQQESRQAAWNLPEDLRTYLRNRMIYGCFLRMPTTPSTNADYNVDVTDGCAVYDGVPDALAAQVDVDTIAVGVGYTRLGAAAGLIADTRTIAARVFFANRGPAPTKLVFVYGDAIATGGADPTPPSDAEVLNVLGTIVGATYWYELASMVLTRIDPAFTQAIDVVRLTPPSCEEFA